MNATLTEEPITYLGVAITADAIECELGGQSYLTLNGPEGHTDLLARLGQLGGAIRVVCEQAGGREIPLVRALHAAGFAVAVVPAAEVSSSARLRDASEISPNILARYAAAYTDRLRFIEGSLAPRSIGRAGGFSGPPQTSRNAQKAPSLWMRIVDWLSRATSTRSESAVSKRW